MTGEAKDVQLGEQPEHLEPSTPEELQSVKETNAVTTQASWDKVNKYLVKMKNDLPEGKDAATMELRSWLTVQEFTTRIKAQQGK